MMSVKHDVSCYTGQELGSLLIALIDQGWSGSGTRKVHEFVVRHGYIKVFQIFTVQDTPTKGDPENGVVKFGGDSFDWHKVQDMLENADFDEHYKYYLATRLDSYNKSALSSPAFKACIMLQFETARRKENRTSLTRNQIIQATDAALSGVSNDDVTDLIEIFTVDSKNVSNSAQLQRRAFNRIMTRKAKRKMLLLLKSSKAFCWSEAELLKLLSEIDI